MHCETCWANEKEAWAGLAPPLRVQLTVCVVCMCVCGWRVLMSCPPTSFLYFIYVDAHTPPQIMKKVRKSSLKETTQNSWKQRAYQAEKKTGDFRNPGKIPWLFSPNNVGLCHSCGRYPHWHPSAQECWLPPSWRKSNRVFSWCCTEVQEKKTEKKSSTQPASQRRRKMGWLHSTTSLSHAPMRTSFLSTIEYLLHVHTRGRSIDIPMCYSMFFFSPQLEGVGAHPVHPRDKQTKKKARTKKSKREGDANTKAARDR